MTDPPLRITIELDCAQRPIRGRLRTDGQPASSFFGWLELASALDRMLVEDDRAAPLPPPPPPSNLTKD